MAPIRNASGVIRVLELQTQKMETPMAVIGLPMASLGQPEKDASFLRRTVKSWKRSILQGRCDHGWEAF